MPTRDRARFIPLAIKSFLSQTFTNSELVIVEDGIGKDTIQHLLPNDPRIVYVRLDNIATIGAKRNTACSIARGKIIVHWDDDDWSHPKRIEEQVLHLEKSGAMLTGYHTILYWNELDSRAYKFSAPAPYASGTSQCYYKTFWEQHRFPDVNVGEDGVLSTAARNLRVLHSTTGDNMIVARAHDFNTWKPPLGRHYQFPVCKKEDLPQEFWDDISSISPIPRAMDAEFNLISNINNGHGLQCDYEIVRNLIESLGYKTNGVQFNEYKHIRRAQINIFLETAVPKFFDYAGENWLVPNSEWWEKEYDSFLPRFSRILCKTPDCYRLFKAKVGNVAQYIGFESRDFYKPNIPRELKFLHIAGKSESKNTDVILDAWRKYEIPYELSLMTTREEFQNAASQIRNVVWYPRMGDGRLVHMLNSHQFHLCPSKYEGWGHYIHEARAVGAVILTTNAPPMNEFAGIDKSMLIPSYRLGPQRLATLWSILPEKVVETVNLAAKMTPEEVRIISKASREGFEQDRTEFRTRLTAIIREGI